MASKLDATAARFEQSLQFRSEALARGVAIATPGTPREVRFSANGRWLAIASEGPHLQIFDIFAGETVLSLNPAELKKHLRSTEPLPPTPTSLMFLHTGTGLVCGFGTRAVIWTANERDDWFHGPVFTTNAALQAASGQQQDRLAIADLTENGFAVLLSHFRKQEFSRSAVRINHPLAAMNFAPDDATLLAVTRNGLVYSIAVTNDVVAHQEPLTTGDIHKAAFTHDGLRLVALTPARLTVWQIDPARQLAQADSPIGEFIDLSLFAETDSLITIAATPTGGELASWSLKTLTRSALLQLASQPLCVATARHDTVIACGLADQSLLLRDFANERSRSQVGDE